MKKYLKLFVVAIAVMVFLPLYVFADDERTVISHVEITSNMATPVYGGEAKTNYTYTTTVGEPAYMTPHMGAWYKKDGSNWSKYGGSLFKEGTYKYYNQIRIDNAAGLTHKFANQTTLLVDSVAWTQSIANMEVYSTFSMGYFWSPEYIVEKDNNLELTFVGNGNFNILTNYVNQPIVSYTVSDAVLGGTEPYTFSKTSGPSWINVSSNGTVSGTPTSMGSNSNLIVKVTDATSAYKEITITVADTECNPEDRTTISHVEITSNMGTPSYGGELKSTYAYTTTVGSPAYMTPHMGAWYKKNGSSWSRYEEPTFEEGTYKYYNQIRIDDAAGKTHKLGQPTTLIIDGQNWTLGDTGVEVYNTYSMAYYWSPEYEVSKQYVSQVNLTGIVSPVEGETPVVEGIASTTPGVHVSNAVWILDKPEYEEATTFVLGQRYILIVVFSLDTGYEFVEGFDEDHVTFNTTNQLKSEFVGDGPDIRISYEAKAKIPPKITKAPTVKVSNANNNSLLVSWNEVTNAEKYEVYRSENKKKWNKVGTVTTTSFTNTGLTYGKTYYYKVKAINSVSNKTSSVVNGKTKPNKVTNLRITSAGTNSIKMAWNKVSVTGYEVYRSEDNKKWTKVTTITKNGTLTFNNKKLKANKKYYYKVRAYKTVSGKKIYGSYSDVVYTRTAPEAPKVSLKNVNVQTIKFSFNSSKGSSYYIAQLSDESKFEAYDEATFDAPTSELLNYFIPGTTIYVRVKACNSYNNCSKWTTVSKKVVPSTPSITLKSTKTKKVNIKTTITNDYVDGLEIYRATSKNGKYSMAKKITNDTPESEYTYGESGDGTAWISFDDKTTKGKTYYYKVRTYVIYDGKKIYSSYTGIKSIKSK